jgi:hypothetical protein
MAKLSATERIRRSIANRKQEVFMRNDFTDLAGPSQLSVALKELLTSGYIVRIGYGVYAKATMNQITNKPRPRVTLDQLTAEFLEKRDIPIILGRAQREYSDGKTTQIPMTTAFYTGKRRVSRKLTVGRSVAKYESTY